MKKIFLALGYLAWFFVGAHYTKEAVTKKGLKGTPTQKAQALGKEFVESHKKAFTELKKEYWTAENKKLVLSKKKDLEKFFELAKDEFAEAQEVLKEKGFDTKAIAKHIEEIYDDRKEYIEKLGNSPTAKKAKRKLSDLARKIKKSI